MVTQNLNSQIQHFFFVVNFFQFKKKIRYSLFLFIKTSKLEKESRKNSMFLHIVQASIQDIKGFLYNWSITKHG